MLINTTLVVSRKQMVFKLAGKRIVLALTAQHWLLSAGLQSRPNRN
jgi:hypothetical protein